jgi:hypothetical protein
MATERMLVGHSGRRRWAWSRAHPGAFTFRLMCRAEAGWASHQDRTVDDMSSTGDTVAPVGGQQDLPGGGQRWLPTDGHVPRCVAVRAEQWQRGTAPNGTSGRGAHRVGRAFWDVLTALVTAPYPSSCSASEVGWSPMGARPSPHVTERGNRPDHDAVCRADGAWVSSQPYPSALATR